MPRQRPTNQPFTFMIHFQGDILAEQHEIGFRTYIKTLNHISNAIDRATISENRNSLHKKDIISRNERDLMPLIIQDPENGGYIAKLYDLTGSEFVKKVMDKVANAMDIILRTEDAERMTKNQIKERIERYENDEHLDDLALRNQLIEPEDGTVQYSTRVIGREINQAITALRDKDTHQATINLALRGENGIRRVEFNKERAEHFNNVVSSRYVSSYRIYRLKFLSADFAVENLVAKALDENTNKIRNVMFRSRPIMRSIREDLDEDFIEVIACPIFEGGAADGLKGDLYFIKKYND